jgi:hypothetical protein
MEVISYSIYEGLVNDLYRVNFLHLYHNRPHSIDNLVSVFRLHEVRYFTSIQKIVNVFKEALIDNLGISHDETVKDRNSLLFQFVYFGFLACKS